MGWSLGGFLWRVKMELHEKKINDLWNEFSNRAEKEFGNKKDSHLTKMVLSGGLMYEIQIRRWVIAIVRKNISYLTYFQEKLHKELVEPITKDAKLKLVPIRLDDVSSFLIDKFELTEEEIRIEIPENDEKKLF